MKTWLAATTAFMVPELAKLFMEAQSTQQMDLTPFIGGLDLQNQTLNEYVNNLCSPGSDHLILDFPTNIAQNIEIMSPTNGISEASIFIDGHDKGSKVCVETKKDREFSVTPKDGDTQAFHKITGHEIHKTKYKGTLEMMWTESNTGDEGARQNLAMKFMNWDRTTNTKVNYKNSVARQRGTKFLIFDVTKLQLSAGERLSFTAALAKYYESNFWIQFKSAGFLAMMILLIAKSIKSFKDFGKLEDSAADWKRKVS